MLIRIYDQGFFIQCFNLTGEKGFNNLIGCLDVAWIQKWTPLCKFEKSKLL